MRFLLCTGVYGICVNFLPIFPMQYVVAEWPAVGSHLSPAAKYLGISKNGRGMNLDSVFGGASCRQTERQADAGNHISSRELLNSH